MIIECLRNPAPATRRSRRAPCFIIFFVCLRKIISFPDALTTQIQNSNIIMITIHINHWHDHMMMMMNLHLPNDLFQYVYIYYISICIYLYIMALENAYVAMYLVITLNSSK